MITTCTLPAEKSFCVEQIREVLTGTNLKSLARMLAIGSATVVLFDKTTAVQKMKEDLQAEGVTLGDIETPHDNLSEDLSRYPFSISDLLPEAWERLYSDQIIFTANQGFLKIALITNPNMSWSSVGKLESSEKPMFKVTRGPSDVNHIRKFLRDRADKAGHHVSRAIERLKQIRVHGDNARGPISKWKQWSAWLYTAGVLLVAVISVILNWKGSDSSWERIFGGIEFLTFALVGVFGVVKLAGEDDNAIRNTFLGYKKLMSEEDVGTYIKTEKVALALALYHEKSLDWVNRDYICYCTVPGFGGIAIPSGLNREDAQMAGIYPIGSDAAADLRTGLLREVTKVAGENTEDAVYHLREKWGAPEPPTCEPRWEYGRFRGKVREKHQVKSTK